MQHKNAFKKHQIPRYTSKEIRANSLHCKLQNNIEIKNTKIIER